MYATILRRKIVKKIAFFLITLTVLGLYIKVNDIIENRNMSGVKLADFHFNSSEIESKDDGVGIYQDKHEVVQEVSRMQSDQIMSTPEREAEKQPPDVLSKYARETIASKQTEARNTSKSLASTSEKLYDSQGLTAKGEHPTSGRKWGEMPTVHNSSGIIPMIYGTNKPIGDELVVLLWHFPHAIHYNNEAMNRCQLPPSKRCFFTEDVTYYNQSEAVIISLMHARENIPAYRFPFQKWVFREMEPPPQVWSLRLWKTREHAKKFANLFNLTSTPNIDSDVMSGRIFRKCDIAPDKLKELENQRIDYSFNKSHRVAWFVSHCFTQSRRMDYVLELQKHIPVDIYGKCGNLTCADMLHREDCMMLLKDKYKFYLSFENSICKAYVTEKLSRITENPVTTIPVVLGGVNYSFVLPQETYIDVQNFSSPKALADFMKKIDNDDGLFNHYIRRKLALDCHEYPAESGAFGCRMCQYLHERRDKRQIAPDVTVFYGEETQCKRPEDYFKGIDLPYSPQHRNFGW